MSEEIQPIVLLGTTVSGKKFRPSDWAQRLTVAVSTVNPKNRKIISHPKVHMAMRDGLPAVIVDPVLRQENGMMFDFFINFAKSNNLQIENLPADLQEETKGEDTDLQVAKLV